MAPAASSQNIQAGLAALAALLALLLLASHYRSYSTSLSHGNANAQEPAAQAGWCQFGVLGAYWATTERQGRHWHIFKQDCKLRDLLGAISANQTELGSPAQSTATDDLDHAGSHSPQQTQPVSSSQMSFGLMFLSDSVDRHILTYMCELAGGTVMLMNQNGTPQRPLTKRKAHTNHALRHPMELVQPAASSHRAHKTARAWPEQGISTAPQSHRLTQPNHAVSPAGSASSHSASAYPQALQGRQQAASRPHTAIPPRRPHHSHQPHPATDLHPMSTAPPHTTAAASNSQHALQHARATLARQQAVHGEPQPSQQAATKGAATRGTEEVPAPRMYLPHVCWQPSVPGLRLVATYFPGVHPHGPYHKGVRSGWQTQVPAAVSVWRQLFPEQPSPDLVVVAASLWDLARMSAHEPHLMAAPELSPQVLESWVANYSQVVAGVRRALPEAPLLLYHTTMAPRYNSSTSLMERSYLGRRFFITQLNAAGRHAAQQLGLELVDYAAVANRFMEGQSYLVDAMHPNRLVGLEIANLYLNFAAQVQAQRAKDPTWRHPSTFVTPPQSSHSTDPA